MRTQANRITLAGEVKWLYSIVNDRPTFILRRIKQHENNMKERLALLLAFISILSFGQVDIKSIEPFPAVINNPAAKNFSPSFNNLQNKLCFIRSTRGEDVIMIADKSGNDWQEPYAAIRFTKKKILSGVKINSSGTRIYFGMNNDLYFSEYIGEKKWSVSLRMDEISSAASETNPSITSDEKTIGFLKTIRNADNTEWMRVPYIAEYNPKSGWSETKIAAIQGLKTEVDDFLLSQSKEAILFATFSGTTFKNYFATWGDSTYSNISEINFSGGRIKWISDDFSTGLAETFTDASKIVKINFQKSWFGQEKNNAPVEISSRKPNDQPTENQTSVKPTGKYYGLLLGVSNYEDHNLSLDNPAKDVIKLSEVLTSSYYFDKTQLKILIDPTRQEILSELFKLRSLITPNDNLLIFFAGHGYWDKSVEQGYWWPKDAKTNDPSFWLSNSDLREQIRGIKSGHTLLISDACFSGGIFKTRGVENLYTAPTNIQLLYKTKSRRAITSGNLSSVPDKSVFFDYLIKRLLENEEDFLPSQMLFNSLKTAVINNAMNIPQEGIISDSGDEGGDFIFIKKRD